MSSTASQAVAAEQRQALRSAGEAETSPVTLTVPMPPSVNNAFVNLRRGGRAKSRATKDWESHALWHVKAQHPPIVAGPVLILLGFERTAASADADNRVKLTLDLLVKAGVIEDDRFVVGAAFSWLPPANRMAHVVVAPAEHTHLQFLPSHDGAAGGWLLAPPSPKETTRWQ